MRKKKRLRKKAEYYHGAISDALAALLYYDIPYDDILNKTKSYDPKSSRVIDSIYQRDNQIITDKIIARKAADDAEDGGMDEKRARSELVYLRQVIAYLADSRSLWQKF